MGRRFDVYQRPLGEGDGTDMAIFLYSHGKLTMIAKSVDEMPGGGTLAPMSRST